MSSSIKDKSDEIISLLTIPLTFPESQATKHTSYELLNRDETPHGSRLKDFNKSSRFEFIEIFLNEIKLSFSNIPEEGICRDDEGYQYPSTTTIEKYHDQYDMDKNTHFINEGKEQLSKAINDIIVFFNQAKESLYRNMVITGKVGSGKSSFVKLLCNQINNSCDSHDEKLVHALITYEGVKEETRQNYNNADWKARFEQLILDQVAFRVIDSLKDEKEYSLSLKNWLDMRKGAASWDDQTVSSLEFLANLCSQEKLLTEWTVDYVSDILTIPTKTQLVNSG